MVSAEQLREAIINAFKYFGNERLTSIVENSYISIYYQQPRLDEGGWVSGNLWAYVYYDDSLAKYMTTKKVRDIFHKVYEATNIIINPQGARDGYKSLAKLKNKDINHMRTFLCLQEYIEQL